VTTELVTHCFSKDLRKFTITGCDTGAVIAPQDLVSVSDKMSTASCTSMPPSVPLQTDTPRKQKLKKLVNKLRKRNYRLKKASNPLHRVRGIGARRRAAIVHILSELSQYLPEETVNFIRNQITGHFSCSQTRSTMEPA